MIDINYICFLNESGYGQAAYDLICSLLENKNYNININCLNGRPSKNFLAQESFQKINKLVDTQKDRRGIQIYHCIPTMQMRYPRHDKAVGFATYETYEPPKAWIDILNNMDAVICPSLFNYKIFAHAGIKRPIFYVPHCVDTQKYHKIVIKLQTFHKFTFLFTGTWKKRKGWPQLIEAFLQEFDSSEKVQLLIKTDKIQVAMQEIEKMKQQLNIKKEYPPILFESRIFNDEFLPSFYKSADCLVMPTLGEGFGLPALQSMAVGVPVIVTNFSGCQDYATDETCTLLEPQGFILHNNMDNISQFANRKWPHIPIISIQNAMRNVYSNYNVAITKADKAYDYVQEKFSYKTAAKHFQQVMETVYRVS